MFDDRIDAVSLDDRSITEPHNEVLDARSRLQRPRGVRKPCDH